MNSAGKLFALFAIVGLASFGCEKHSFEDTKILHLDHGSHDDNHGGHGDEHHGDDHAGDDGHAKGEDHVEKKAVKPDLKEEPRDTGL